LIISTVGVMKQRMISSTGIGSLPYYEGLRAAQKDRREQPFLAAEIIVDQAKIDVVGLGDHPERRRVVPTRRELELGHVEDPVPRTGLGDGIRRAPGLAGRRRFIRRFLARCGHRVVEKPGLSLGLPVHSYHAKSA
jgi:hypothetical protein